MPSLYWVNPDNEHWPDKARPIILDVRPSAGWPMGLDRGEKIITPQRVTRRYFENGGPLLLPGTSLVTGLHFALFMMAGRGRIFLIGADGQNVGGQRRFLTTGRGDDTSDETPHLTEANRILGECYLALRGMNGLELFNGTPGSAIPHWPIVELPK